MMYILLMLSGMFFLCVGTALIEILQIEEAAARQADKTDVDGDGDTLSDFVDGERFLIWILCWEKKLCSFPVPASFVCCAIALSFALLRQNRDYVVFQTVKMPSSCHTTQRNVAYTQEITLQQNVLPPFLLVG